MMRTKKKLLWGIFFLLDATGICQAAPIRIGLSLSLTGEYAIEAKMQERAFRLWEAHVNESGGILGRKVKLTIYDDQSDTETAKKLYRVMIEKEKLDFLFGPYSSDITMAILPITEKQGYPILTSGASADSIWQQDYRNVFGILPPASRYPLGVVELLLTHGFDKVALILVEDTFSQNVALGVKKWVDRLGMQIVLRKTVPKGTRQLEPLAQRVKESGAHALLMCGHFNEAVYMRQALKNINWYPKAYWTSVGPVFQDYYDRLGALAENSFSTVMWKYCDKLPFPGGKAFYDTFTATYHVEANYHAAAAYAVGIILQAAIEKAGDTDRENVRDMLSTMDITTLVGRYGVDRTGMQIKHFAMTIQWINGRQKIVWPPELSTSQPIFP